MMILTTEILLAMAVVTTRTVQKIGEKRPCRDTVEYPNAEPERK